MGLKVWLGLSVIALMLSACGNQAKETSSSRPVVAEKVYCGTVNPVGTPTTVTSTAQYQRYNDNPGGLTSTSTRPIRAAEAVIYNSDGNTIQCGQSDGAGNISMQIPKAAGTYILQVNSRADNNDLKLSVLNNPTDNNFYSISVTFTLDGSENSKAVTLPVAPRNGTLEGGAFNILDQVYQANVYLRANVTGFTVAPKIPIFWTAGLTPYAYYGYPNSGISFFSASSGGGISRGIYILGGIQGSVCTDTDHFDNSVILHEYGHYLEDAYASADSPGGSHNGNAVIDPRLAWSEGWASFFQAAVLSRNFYRDTDSNIDCPSYGLYIELDLENRAAQDTPTQNGEGTFREVSVSRSLYDALTAVGQDTDGQFANLGFEVMWKAFSDNVFGLKSSNLNFRNVSLFNQLLADIVTTEVPAKLAAFQGTVAYERQRTDETDYGLNVVPQAAGACSFNFVSGGPVTSSSGLFQFASNKYYEYYYDGNAAHASVVLRYSAAGTPYDLNVRVYQKDYFFNSEGIVATSASSYPESGGTGYEAVSFSGLGAGFYLIQVTAVHTGGAAKATTNYYLETNGGAKRLCP